MGGLRRGTRRGRKKRACPPPHSGDHAVSPLLHAGSRRCRWGTRRKLTGSRDAGMKGGGTQGLVLIPRNNCVGRFVTPFPSCAKPSSDSFLCLIAPSSVLVNGGPHLLPRELGLSPGSPRLLQGWSRFSAGPWRWETLSLGEEELTQGSLGSNNPSP